MVLNFADPQRIVIAETTGFKTQILEKFIFWHVGIYFIFILQTLVSKVTCITNIQGINFIRNILFVYLFNDRTIIYFHLIDHFCLIILFIWGGRGLALLNIDSRDWHDEKYFGRENGSGIRTVAGQTRTCITCMSITAQHIWSIQYMSCTLSLLFLFFFIGEKVKWSDNEIWNRSRLEVMESKWSSEIS